MPKPLRIAYIGGGSRLWARSLMSDLALEATLEGVIALYDIDIEAAKRNAQLGNKMMQLPEAKGRFVFEVSPTLESALQGADFVLISILPGTFDDMEVYVHGTEPWGVYQTVGDTTGPAGIFRALIMMPMYEVIAKAIERHCPDAWVLNFTNPMTMCVETLYHIFPKIKAFGNCHEVFFVQRILARALKEETGIDADFKDIQINVQGINHFTWINRASYQDIDLLPLYRRFASKFQPVGLQKGDDWKHVGPFGSAERVKLDLFLKTGVVAAAGDRHLVEFLPHDWYMTNKATIESWRFFLTPVSLRKQIMKNGDASAKRILAGEEPLRITPSGEDGIAQIRALVGLETLLTNVNTPNVGQIANLPKGHVVETNALFRKDSVEPVFTGTMPNTPRKWTMPHLKTHRLLLEAFEKQSLAPARIALHGDPSVGHLDKVQIDQMFEAIAKQIELALTYYKY
jgi:galacturan 1,4-alpha-galacturonidase